MSMFLVLSLEKTKSHPERRILAFLHGLLPQCMSVRRSQVGVLSEECSDNRRDLEKVEWRQLIDLKQTNKQTESISEGCLHSSCNGKATKVFRHRERACLAEKNFTSLPINRICRREILHHGSREIDTVGQFFDSAQFKLIHSFPHTIPFLSKEIKESKQISSIRSRNECLPTHSLISSP